MNAPEVHDVPPIVRHAPVWVEVTYFNHQTFRYRVDGVGWKVSTSRRVLIFGHGVPRMEIPLDNVMLWRIYDEPKPVPR